MKQIEATIIKIVKNKAGREKFLLYCLKSRWEQIMGVQIAKHSAPTRLERGILYVNTDNPAWSHNLLMMKLQLLVKIRHSILSAVSLKTAEATIKDMMFQNGLPKNTGNEETEEDEVRIVPAPLSREEESEIEKHLSGLASQKLKTVLARVMKNDKKRKNAIKAAFSQNCKNCGVPIIGEENYCPVCQRERKEQIYQKTAEILNTAPWLSYEECINFVNCDKMLFSEIRDRLKMKTYQKLKDEDCDSNTKIFATLLELGIEPKKLTEEIIEETTEKLRRDMNVSTFRRGLRSEKH